MSHTMVQTPALSRPDGLTTLSIAANSSTILYCPPGTRPEKRNPAATPPRLPVPQIRARQRRPHSIHIVSYPTGYIPHDLRVSVPETRPPPSLPALNLLRAATTNALPQIVPPASCNLGSSPSDIPPPRRHSVAEPLPTRSRGTVKLFFATLRAPFSKSSRKTAANIRQSRRASLPTPSTSPISPPGSLSCVIEEPSPPIVQSNMARSLTVVEAAGSPFLVTTNAEATVPHKVRNGIVSSTRHLRSDSASSVLDSPKAVASGGGLNCTILLAEPYIFLTGFDHDGRRRGNPRPSGTALLRGRLQLNINKNVKIKSVALKLSGRARTEWPEGIPPAKTDLFEESSLRTQVLSFFHALHDSWETPYGNQCHYVLHEANSRNGTSSPHRASWFGSGSNSNNHNTSPTHLKPHSRDLKRLSLQTSRSRSLSKESVSNSGGSSLAVRPSNQVAKGFKVFHPGRYEYNFELPIDHHQLETIDLPFGSVKWELEAVVERAGPFKPNLHGTREVPIVRVPDQLSLETTEPIIIGRQWEDQLHYEIMISGKSFPIGSTIPIAFKLTPLAKVQVHKLKVFLTESIEYWTSDKKVTRKDQGRKILLLEKAAGKPIDRNRFPGCEMQILSGGEYNPHEDAGVGSSAAAAAARPPPNGNLLGKLEPGLESFWGSTEIEMDVQIPTCNMIKRDKSMRLNPDCSWKNVNVFHWIKIVMRISRLDEDDPAGQRRRHFEISIDSPITLLNCRATHANTSLPQYVDLDAPPGGIALPSYAAACGCPDAGCMTASDTTALYLSSGLEGGAVGAGPMINTRPMNILRKPSFTPPAFDADDPPPPISPELRPVRPVDIPHSNLQDLDNIAQPYGTPGRCMRITVSRPSTPPTMFSMGAVHVVTAPMIAAGSSHGNHSHLSQHQNHFMTPPPTYDAVVGTPSIDGLADYLARLARFEDDDSLESSDGLDDGAGTSRPARLTARSGRVNVANPLSPAAAARAAAHGRAGRIYSESLLPSRSLEHLRPSRRSFSQTTLHK